MDKELKARMSLQSDDELLQIVGPQRANYRQEAIDYASEELVARGIPLTQLPSEPSDEPDYLASTGRRFLNCLIDIVVMAVILVILEPVFGKPTLVVFLLYYFAFELTLQRTPAKFLTRTKVVTLDGSKPNAVAILKRTLTRLVPFEPLLWDGDKSLHDRWSGTEVVRI